MEMCSVPRLSRPVAVPGSPTLREPRDPTLLVLLSRRLNVTPFPFCRRLDGLV